MKFGRSGHLAAAQSAARALTELGIDQTRPVDPFEAINLLGLELIFKPLGDLLGVVVPGSKPGVLINSARPASVQRFTAAHEIGHWRMDQGALALDKQDDVEGTPHEQRERNAQIFASHFLMPIELFYATAIAHGVTKGGTVSPISVYEMARDMHVSYRAAVLQLVNTNFISSGVRNQLLSIQPATLKTTLTHGRRPANTRGDVWALSGTAGSLSVDVFVGDEIVVALPENPSTGYRWITASNNRQPRTAGQTAPPHRFGGSTNPVDWNESRSELGLPDTPSTDGAVLLTVADDLDSKEDSSPPIAVGSQSVRRFGFTATRAGQSSVELDYVRTFSAAPPVESMVLTAHVRDLPEVEERRRRLQSFALEERAIADSSST